MTSGRFSVRLWYIFADFSKVRRAAEFLSNHHVLYLRPRKYFKTKFLEPILCLNVQYYCFDIRGAVIFEHHAFFTYLLYEDLARKRICLYSCCLGFKQSLSFFQFPISLAINLSVRKEHLINKTHKTHAAVKTTQKTEEKKAGPSDEVDTSRTHRRFKRYEESVHDFIDYFKKTDRILTVNTGSGRNDVIWESIMAYFVDSDIVRWQRPLDLVLLFCFCKYLVLCNPNGTP